MSTKPFGATNFLLLLTNKLNLFFYYINIIVKKKWISKRIIRKPNYNESCIKYELFRRYV